MESSSQAQGISLQHRPHGAGYRLLELPMEVQSLLESDEAPVLKLTSSDASAILETPDRTYALSQKNTSNALLLLAPDTYGQALSVIATLHETVDLDVAPVDVVQRDQLKDTGSRGKWHEKFGKGR